MSVHFTGFHSPLRAAVFGASGGIGGALVAALEQHPDVAEVIAFTRSTDRIRSGSARIERVDILDESSIAAAAEFAGSDAPLDLVIVATGILHDGERLQPEKTLRELDAERMAEVFRINAFAPAIIAKHFLPVLRRRHKTVFAALSARVGSIGDNRLGGWTSYRSSKAALNMILKTLSVEHARRFKESVIVGLHPGTVDTGLSKPFQQRVPDEQLFDAEKAAGCLLEVIDGLDADDTGGFYAWDGQEIPY